MLVTPCFAFSFAHLHFSTLQIYNAHSAKRRRPHYRSHSEFDVRALQFFVARYCRLINSIRPDNSYIIV